MGAVIVRLFKGVWIRLWMRMAGPGVIGRIASWLAATAVPPFFGRIRLANLTPKGFIAPSARVHHTRFSAGSHVFLDDRVLIYENGARGSVSLGDDVRICRDSILETGADAHIAVGDGTFIQPRCQLIAHKASIRIGRRVQMAAGCALYPYDHGIAPDRPIWDQPLTSRGDIMIGDDAWLGYGVVVLSGVRIGAGAVVGAGSVVTRDIPDGGIAVGNPARVVRMRDATQPPLAQALTLHR